MSNETNPLKKFLQFAAAADAARRAAEREGTYSFGAPQIRYTDDEIVAMLEVTVTTALGETLLTTTAGVSRGDTSYPVVGLAASDVGYVVKQVMERARDAALATIDTIEDEWAKTVAESDSDEDEDEGLREGAVVGGAPALDDEVPYEFPAYSTAESLLTAAELRRRTAFAEARVAELKVAELDGDTIRIPNSEYADLIAAKRQGELTAKRMDHIDALYPDCRVFNLASGAVQVRGTAEGLGAIQAALWPAPQSPVSGATETASDVSDNAQDDGGSVEPELDIDALVAGVDVQRDTCSLDIRAMRSGQFPVLKVVVTGPGSAAVVRQIITDIHLPALTEPLVRSYPVDIDFGGNSFEATTLSPLDDVKAFARSVKAGI